MITISRRRFLTIAGGAVLAGCSAQQAQPAGRSSTTTTSLWQPSGTTPPTGAVPVTSEVTTVAAPDGVVPDGGVLVLVEMAGGNDALNTLPPLADSYRLLRPTLAIPEDELVASAALTDHALHPSLAPLVPFLDAGRLAAVAGIGFQDPDRSHFYSIDRWQRADRMDDSIGWLGRWLDTLTQEPAALHATALGGTGEMLLGDGRSGTVIDGSAALAFPSSLGNQAIRQLTEPVSTDPMLAAAQEAFLNSVGAVEAFDPIADAARDDLSADGIDYGPATTPFQNGLAIAAQMVVGDVGTRVVTITVNGFDTHSNQLATHAALLDDLAAGLVAFWDTVDAAGMSDRVLLATHSEFGRRVAENGSAGCDHGAAGVSFVMGSSIRPGVHGRTDADDLVDGDMRPIIDPRSLFTTCLDWLGADVERILGDRYDDVSLLA